jgi:hypothetical protein
MPSSGAAPSLAVEKEKKEKGTQLIFPSHSTEKTYLSHDVLFHSSHEPMCVAE